MRDYLLFVTAEVNAVGCLHGLVEFAMGFYEVWKEELTVRVVEVGKRLVWIPESSKRRLGLPHRVVGWRSR